VVGNLQKEGPVLEVDVEAGGMQWAEEKASEANASSKI
jgi:hypothetical protein